MYVDLVKARNMHLENLMPSHAWGQLGARPNVRQQQGWDWDPADLISFATALTDLTMAVILVRETRVERDLTRAQRMWWQLTNGSWSAFVPLDGLDHWEFPD
ncbi:hypothetical protein HDU88_008103 [Geranomyces variabilis]|nr:hypothetical protein HDU88_008103 [Geranomyces variabilis]